MRRSMIWFNPFDAPVSKYPPTAIFSSVGKSISSVAMNQPSTADSTTKNPKRSLKRVATSLRVPDMVG